jgi:hypothetical protein
MKAKLPSARVVGLGAAAVLALLGFAQLGDAGTTLRGARDISGLWMQYPFKFNFDPSIKFREPQSVLLQPEYEARYKAYLAAAAQGEAEGKPLANASTLCLPNGMPLSMSGFAPMEFVITPKVVYVFAEGWEPPRHIFMGRHMPPLDDVEPSFEGYSVGQWVGNTLVVDTAGVKIRTDIEGVPHSDALRINERIRLLDDDTLEIVFKITDPKAFKAPWIITKQYKDYATESTSTLIKITGTTDHGKYPNHGDAELTAAEVVCNENNRNMPGADGLVRDGVAPPRQ